MRKTFLTFCAAALALLAVSSCGKLEDGLNSLKGELADLKDRVEKLESKLNSEVSALQQTMATLATKQDVNTALGALKTSLEAKDAELASSIQSAAATLAGLDAKYVGKSTYDAALAELNNKNSALQAQLNSLAALLGETSVADVKAELLAEIAEAVAAVTVTVVENQNGSVVITLANGESFTVAKDANVNNTGLVTVDEEGNWCVILEDGSLKSLDAKVGVEELEFSVDYDTKELLYSVNGGAFQGTGAYVSDWDATVVTDFYEDDNFVYITVGGVEYTLVKASTNVFQIQSGKAYFTAGETRTFKVKSTGVVSSFLANAPKGWDVVLSKSTLTVTAPEEGAVADEEGTIELWVLMDDGLTLLGTLGVSMQEAPFTFTIDGNNVTLDVVGKSVTIEDEYGAYDSFVSDVVFGACPANEFNPEALIAAINDAGWAAAPEGAYNNFDYMEYEWLDKVEMTIDDLLGYEFESGSLVVWGILRGYEANLTLTANDFVLEYVNKISVSVSHESSWNDAEVEIVVDGAEEFFAMAMPKEHYEGYVAEYWSDEAVEAWGQMGFGFEQLFFPGMLHYSSHVYASGSYSATLVTFGFDPNDWESQMNNVAPNEEWVVLVLPMTKDSKNDYRLSDVTVYELATNPLTAGGSAAVTFDAENAVVGYNSIELPATATGIVYYNVFTTEQLEAEELVDAEGTLDEYAVIDYLLDVEQYITEGEYLESLYVPSLQSGVEYTIVAIAIDENGQYGDLATAKVTTKSMPWDQTGTVKATVESVTFDPENAKVVTVVYAVENANMLAVNAGTSGPACVSSYTEKSITTWAENLCLNPYMYNLSKHQVVDGKVTVTYKNYNPAQYYNYKYVYFCAYNTDENGVITSMSPMSIETSVVDLSTYATAE